MQKSDDANPARRRKLLAKPDWVEAREHAIASRIRVHPNVLSSVKLVVVLPPLVLALQQVDVLPYSTALTVALVVAFFVLDYLDGIVARHRGLATPFGRIFDRLTDYPLLVVVCYLNADVLPPWLLVTKVGLDLMLLALYALGRGVSDNRLRTALSYTTLLALLLLSQGWAPRVLTVASVEALLGLNIAFSAAVALSGLGLLRKRFLADVLSACNLLCGIVSILFATRGRFEMSLLFVVLGAAFDGFDGAAARRFGGTRFGVYSDDIADGINYGIAPGVALYFALGGGISGAAIGVFYSLFTIARLVFFTLDKATSDPNYFSGVPSPAGGLITMSSILVFAGEPALIGLMVGMACAQMVSFSTHYRHLGRALAQHRRALVGAPVYAVALLIGLRVWGARGAAATILVPILFYGFLPTMLAFRRVLQVRRATRAGRAQAEATPPAADEVAALPDESVVGGV
ncbi:MAG: CDP-alcohol phosphatidyltransferase family protein [Nannocystaceae bacterium]|nr:CDP-alcohol phosphatidyltransferase family protein [Nannocystaceae bacterium]